MRSTCRGVQIRLGKLSALKDHYLAARNHGRDQENIGKRGASPYILSPMGHGQFFKKGNVLIDISCATFSPKPIHMVKVALPNLK